MFVIDDVPSGSVIMFALSRTGPPACGGIVAPDCVSPITGSFSRVASVRPKFEFCEFQLSSVKPRLYAKSCMRVCCTKRFVTAAETSKLLPTTKFVPYGVPGSQSLANHSFVHGNV